MNELHENPLAPWLEDAWLERYLDRGLSDSETAWFEAYMLDKPRLIAAIDTDTALRDGLHAWHAQQRSVTAATDSGDAHRPTVTIAGTPAPSAKPDRRSMWFGPLSMAAAMAAAALLGASAVHWMVPEEVGAPTIASPNRIVFDTLRGSATESLLDRTMVDRSGDTSAPLLIDIAVPMQATAVVAHFSDQSSLPLPVSADGFVSLTGPRDAILARSPIRIAWMLDGEAQERNVDIGAAISHKEG
ncbi:MAG: hypothetical protein WBP11_11120 [Dokdonella sp.]